MYRNVHFVIGYSLFLCVATGWGQAQTEQPKTREQKEVVKECAGVLSERVETLRKFITKQPKDASHGRRVTDARAWAKPTQDQPSIPDGCIAAVVREVLATEKRTEERAKEELKAEDQRKGEALALSEWDQLTEAERAWVIFSWTKRDPPRIERVDLSVGDIGEFNGWVVLNIIQVLDKSSFLAYIDDTDCELGFCLDSKGAKFTGVDTSGIVDGDKLRPQGVYWITDTTTYPRAMGGTNTVYLVSPVALDTDKLKRIVPYKDAIKKGTTKP